MFRTVLMESRAARLCRDQHRCRLYTYYTSLVSCCQAYMKVFLRKHISSI